MARAPVLLWIFKVSTADLQWEHVFNLGKSNWSSVLHVNVGDVERVCQKGCTFVMFKRGMHSTSLHHSLRMPVIRILKINAIPIATTVLLYIYTAVLQSEDQDDLNPKSAGRARCRKPRHQLGRGPLGRSSFLHFNRVESQVLIFGCNAKIDAS